MNTTPDSQHLSPGAMDAELFRALGDRTRLEVLVRLWCASEPQTVSEVASCCGVHLSGVSRHLAVLRDAGIVEATREGREVRYVLLREQLAAKLRVVADLIEGGNCCT